MSVELPSFLKSGMCVACAMDDHTDVPAVGYGKVSIVEQGIELCDRHLREAQAMGWETHRLRWEGT